MVANLSVVCKMDADEILIYNTDVSYLPLSEMAMLHLN